MKILIADDHALFRDTLTENLEQINPDVVVQQVSGYARAVKILEQDSGFDLVIIDADMPDMNWDEGLKRLKNLAEHTDFVVMSVSEDLRQIKKLVEIGLKGYIPKRLDTKLMHNAFKTILEGGTYIPQALSDCSAENCLYGRNNAKTLTNRQSQVLDLIAQGKSNKQIAYEMGVSEATVKLHINALLRSLKVTNRTQAVVTAQKMGLI